MCACVSVFQRSDIREAEAQDQDTARWGGKEGERKGAHAGRSDSKPKRILDANETKRKQTNLTANW